MAVEVEKKMANAIRFLSMDAIQKANSGHPGMPMGMADVATVLFNRFMNIDPSAPDWRNRDRFVLSAGHGSMLLYSIHHLLGYKDMDIEQIKGFRQIGSRTAGHPEFGHADGIEATTGPLGQGITMATGMALGERILNARLGDDVMNHFTYAIAGDGCLMEGISQEAIDFAGLMKLSKLIVLWDDNDITIDGSTELSTVTDQKARFEASGWHVVAVDGHDNDAVAAAIEAAQNDPRPSLVACKTVIGFGAPNKAGSHKVHGAPLGDDEIAATRDALGWSHEAFDVPSDVYEAWHAVAARGKATREAWDASVSGNAELEAHYADHSVALSKAMADYRAALVADKPKLATRVASQKALEVVNAALPNSIGGSADLTPSNNTFTDGMRAITAADYSGDYLHYGIREHGMAAIMNGLALHGGLRPYGGTFLIFSDYARPAIRLSALMSQPVNYVLTHDSIGLGEDGPTHQPVEILAALRAIPNLNVFRPCDAVETAEAWEIGANSTSTPSAHALSRQGLPALRTENSDNLTAKGAYVLRETEGARDVTIIASGSEVSLAVEAADMLAEKGVNAAVVSAPCFELFAAQDKAYQDEVVGSAPRIGVEAAIRTSWDLFLDRDDSFIGMNSFGASAPAGDLYTHFGITVDAIVSAALAKTGK